MSTGWEQEILEQLDQCAQAYDFPMFDNASYEYAGSRMTAFRSTDEWLLAFEVLNYSPSPRRTFDDVYAFGNHVARPGHQYAAELFANDREWWKQRKCLLDVTTPVVVVRGKHLAFSISRHEYASLGIPISKDDEKPIGLLRFLAEMIPDELFLPDGELLRLCGRPAELKAFARLEGWEHPDLANDELPSSKESFTSLARAVATGQPELVNPGSINTDWRRWEHR